MQPYWAPGQAGGKAILEKVQEKALEQIVGLGGETYEEKCKEAGEEKVPTEPALNLQSN